MSQTTNFLGSSERDEIMPRLYEVQGLVGRIGKNASNPHFRSTYADLPHILHTILPLFQERDLVLTQPIRTETHVLADRVVVVHYQQARIEHVGSGQYLVTEIAIDPAASVNPQKVGAALTYYRRFTLQSLLALEVADDDGNTAAGITSHPTAASIPSAPATSSAADALANWGKKQ